MSAAQSISAGLGSGPTDARLLWKLTAATTAAILLGIAAHQDWPGSVTAAIAAIPLALLAAETHAKGWTASGYLAASAALLMLLALALEPGPLIISLFWASCAALSLAAPPSRLPSLAVLSEDLLRNLLATPLKLASDTNLLRQARTTTACKALNAGNLLLPIAAAVIFGLLLITANPIIATLLRELPWSGAVRYVLSMSTPIAIVTFALLWTAFRMQALARTATGELNWASPAWHKRYFTIAAITATLMILNALFAVENALDLSYIWRGIELPAGMTHKDYVHRGAYSLIATALMAGALIVVMFQPGSATESSRTIRWLVYLWVIQNVFLVASSAKRTMDYIDFGGMTLWRISALVWMALVATGLMLIALRIMLRKSNAWLLNANLLAAILVLAGSSLYDYRSFVANYNVDRALRIAAEKGDYGNLAIDWEYNASLGPAAAAPVARLSREVAARMNQLTFAMSPSKSVSDMLINHTKALQSDWRSWTWRNTSYLRQLNALGVHAL